MLETALSLRAAGHEVTVVCDRLAPAASFDGRYDLAGIVCTNRDYDGRGGYFARLAAKARGLGDLAAFLRRERPDFVVCQSEYDAIKLYLVSRLIPFRYGVFVFGQMYQFRTDISRYASIFRPHLEAVRKSRPGYAETIAPTPPRLSLPVRVANELLSRLKYHAIRKAMAVFTLSAQVAWEVSLVYARKDAIVARAAFDEAHIDRARLADPRPLGSPLRLLSVSRLVDKKRIDRLIEAFGRTSVPARLLIVGIGPEEAALKAQAALSPRAQDIRFLGAIDDERLTEELQAADCFISLDIGDYDISVVEAMGKGCRVIVARDFDLESFGPEVTGAWAVEPEAGAIAAAIERLHDMPAPGLGNMPLLLDQTWAALAAKIVAADRKGAV